MVSTFRTGTTTSTRIRHCIAVALGSASGAGQCWAALVALVALGSAGQRWAALVALGSASGAGQR